MSLLQPQRDYQPLSAEEFPTDEKLRKVLTSHGLVEKG
eukprot:gene11623-23155_t